MLTLENIVIKLNDFWKRQGCVIQNGYDLEVGASTFNPMTFFRSLGPEPYRAVCVEPCRRPSDGRYGNNPNRLQFFHQYQIIIKPSPHNIQKMYLESLNALNLDLDQHDIRFVHDDWEQPSLGASGLGWEVWLNGLEISQFTYFQQMASINLEPITVEVVIGLERLAMYLQKVDSVYDVLWSDNISYGEIFKRNEFEWGGYNFCEANVGMWKKHFLDFQQEAHRLLDCGLPIPAYDFVMKASHAFNILDARKAISVSERAANIFQIKNLAIKIAKLHVENRLQQNFPLMSSWRNSSYEKTQEGEIDDIEKHNVSKDIEDLLIEIGSEEIPSTFIVDAENFFETSLKKLLKDRQLNFENVMMFSTPRRLAAYVKGLQQFTSEKFSEKRGPSLSMAYSNNGDITNIGKSFFKSVNVECVPLDSLRSDCNLEVFVKEVKGRKYLFANVKEKSISTMDILKQEVPLIVDSVIFPKKMRWNSFGTSYARPIRWIVAIMGKNVIPIRIGDIVSGNESFGHFQICPAPFTITSPENYSSQLSARYVNADRDGRRRTILEQIHSIEKSTKLVAIEKEKILKEVVNLTEYPTLIVGSFESSFLGIPQEILISEMVEHQKYFPMVHGDGSLANKFIITSNNQSSQEILKGNERTIEARFNDGKFLYEEDMNSDISTLTEKLSSMVYMENVGTMLEKSERLKEFVSILHSMTGLGNINVARKGAELSKIDLVTNLVGEFPSLQGVVGKYYLLNKGEEPVVAKAVEDHWKPYGENSEMPTTDEGILVSLADKIDHLLSCYVANIKPKSSGDPYGMRRCAFGIIRMFLEKKLEAKLPTILSRCYRALTTQLAISTNEQIVEDILEYINQRVVKIFGTLNFDKSIIKGMVKFAKDNVYDAYKRLEAISNSKNKDLLSSMKEIYKRSKGLTSSRKIDSCIDKSYFCSDEEFQLYGSLIATEKALEISKNDKNYENSFDEIIHLQFSLNTFLENVRVLDGDHSANKLALLSRVYSTIESFIDLDNM